MNSRCVYLFACFGLGLAAQALPIVDPSIVPPGGLAPSNTPQIVLLTFDDSVTTSMLARVQQVLTNHVNPNGHPIKATFFVSLDSQFDGASLQHLYADGHEIAVHTMSHLTTTNSDLTRWHQEIAGDRRAISELAQIPVEALVGFRAPFLLMNDSAFSVLASRGFLYDSSFAEDLFSNSISPAAMIWPYTLHNGIQQKANPERIPTNSYPSLFEIPIWDQFPSNGPPVVMDPPAAYTAEQVDALWKTNFTQHYEGNRAPFGVFLHATTTNQWLSDPSNSTWRIATLDNFITWALVHSNTWFVTCHDLVNYTLAPVSIAEAATNAVFLTVTNAYYPNPTLCAYYNSHTFKVCGPCLPAAPTFTNAYYGTIPFTGGVVNFTISSQVLNLAYCSMLVSNNTTNAFFNWQTTFQLTGGTMYQMDDTVWSQSNTLVSTSARQYIKHIYPGSFAKLDFTVSTNGVVAFSAGQVFPYLLGPSDIVIQSVVPEPGRFQWIDNAHEYTVEWSSNLPLQSWNIATNKLFLPVFSNDFPGAINPLFYRVKGTIY